MSQKRQQIVEGQSPESLQRKTKTTPKKKRRSKRKSVQHVHIHIHAGYNNTIVTIAEPNGNVLAWSSSGACGFKGTRKSTPYASQVAAENAVEKGKSFGIQRADVFLKGAGPGREQCIRGIVQAGISVDSITDLTPIPHNGTRRKRVRRV